MEEEKLFKILSLLDNLDNLDLMDMMDEKCPSELGVVSSFDEEKISDDCEMNCWKCWKLCILEKLKED